MTAQEKYYKRMASRRGRSQRFLRPIKGTMVYEDHRKICT
jgi:hypothetical protein